MKTLTIRGVPEEVHEALKERARRNRRSLNQQVIAELSVHAGRIEGDAERRVRVRQTLAEIEEIRAKMERFMTAEEIDAAKRR